MKWDESHALAPEAPPGEDEDPQRIALEMDLEYYEELFPWPDPGVPDSGFESYSTAVFNGWKVIAFDYPKWNVGGSDYLGEWRELYAARTPRN